MSATPTPSPRLRCPNRSRVPLHIRKKGVFGTFTATMAMQRDDPVQLIAQEQVRLFSELKKLPEAAWQHASHCEGWTNARVVAHLITQAEFFNQTVGKAL